ncbi:MAG: hypothetical protein IT378_11590 [Sandaracinaceae bacterium]|nr:hypothetical protein [Sandaracinaceae bacterium]
MRELVFRGGWIAAAWLLSAGCGSGSECGRQLQVVGRYDALPPATEGIDVAAGRAYIATGDALVILDVSQPSAPSLVSSTDLSGFGDRVAFDAGYAYVGSQTSAYSVVDCRNEASPSVVGSLGVDGLDVEARGGRVYLVTLLHLRIVDVADPTQPMLLSETEVGSTIRALAVQGNHAFIADSSGLIVVDVTAPGTPAEVGALAISHATDLAFAGELLLVAARSGGVRVIDVSTPSAPVEVGSYSTDLDARRVTAEGDLGYAGGMSGIRAIDLADPASPRPLAELQTFPAELVAQGGVLFVMTDLRGLEIVQGACR